MSRKDSFEVLGRAMCGWIGNRLAERHVTEPALHRAQDLALRGIVAHSLEHDRVSNPGG